MAFRGRENRRFRSSRNATEGVPYRTESATNSFTALKRLPSEADEEAEDLEPVARLPGDGEGEVQGDRRIQGSYQSCNEQETEGSFRDELHSQRFDDPVRRLGGGAAK